MTPAASVAPTVLPATSSIPTASAGQRVVRAALSLGALSTLGGCALWTAMFSENPPEVPVPTPPTVASAPQAPVSAPAPALVASEPAPSPVVSTPVYVPPPPTPAEIIPPSPLPVAAAPTAPAPSAHGTQSASKAIPSAAGFYLNIGLFAVPTNGSNAVHKLEAVHQPVFSEVIDSKKGPLTRVRVGPFAKRADAEAAAKKIHALKLDAVVFERK